MPNPQHLHLSPTYFQHILLPNVVEYGMSKKLKLGTNSLLPQTSENRHLDDRDVWRIFQLS